MFSSASSTSRVLTALVLSFFVGVAAIAQSTPAWAAPYDVTETIAFTGLQPIDMAFTPDGTTAYVANYGAGTVSVIDTATKARKTGVSDITVGTNPLRVAITPNGAQVYVTNAGSSSVSVISTTSNTVTHTITVGTSPWGVAVSPDGTKAYVANSTSSGSVSVIDTATNAIKEIGGTPVPDIAVGTRPRGVAVSPDGGTVYVANSGGNVSVISTTSNTLTNTITVAGSLSGIAVSLDGSTVYVNNETDDTVKAINTTSLAVTASIGVGTDPRGIAVSPDGTTVYVTNHNTSNSVSVIDTATNAIKEIGGTPVPDIAVGTSPRGIAISPDGTYAYVANLNNSISVIELPVTASASASASASAGPAVSGIFLAVNGVLVGKQVSGAPVYYGSASIRPNSAYSLSVQSVVNSALTRTVLASGTVNSRGHLDQRVELGALAPGTYKIVMTGIHASGYQLVLTNYITVGANGAIVSVSAESQQPFLN